MADSHMDSFGQDDPREMPDFLVARAKEIRYETAVRANVAAQNCSICPRHWYLDLMFSCVSCARLFVFLAREQRVWYEEYGFWIESMPKHCASCQKNRRMGADLRRSYDEGIAAAIAGSDIAQKRRLASIIDELYELRETLPVRINDKRKLLARQIEALCSTDP